jgi:hypothetical protein
VRKFFAFSLGEKVAARPDEGLVSSSQFPRFYAQDHSSPPVYDSLTSPARKIFEAIDFIDEFF